MMELVSAYYQMSIGYDDIEVGCIYEVCIDQIGSESGTAIYHIQVSRVEDGKISFDRFRKPEWLLYNYCNMCVAWDKVFWIRRYA